MAETDGGRDSKRACVAPDEAVLRDQSLLNKAKELHDQYLNGNPYKHIVIKEMFDDAFLRSVQKEIRENLAAAHKETDIYKLRQTGDFANIDGLEESERSQLGSILRLRNFIYSSSFRSFISTVTGCGDLSENVDCAANLHIPGGHLVCHDDVIGDRRVSFIIYMTDPDSDWTSDDGGALELYPLTSEGTPAIRPSDCVLPKWNSMAFFTVEPGVSFHAVQEVFTRHKTRISVQGWFHGPLPVNQTTDKASLSQILDAATWKAKWSATPESVFASSEAEKHLATLAAWINPTYLNVATLEKAANAFKEGAGSVQLRKFLKADLAEKLRGLVVAKDQAEGLGGMKRPSSYGVGVDGGWEEIGPSHIQRYLLLGGNGSDEASSELAKVRDELFRSPSFQWLLAQISGCKSTAAHADVRRFRAGLDYTLAQPGGVGEGNEEILEATIAFVADKTANDRKIWESDEAGGYDCYMQGDGESDPAIYSRVAIDDDVTAESACTNVLAVVKRNESKLRFVKYVSIIAPGSRWDVAGVYRTK